METKETKQQHMAEPWKATQSEHHASTGSGIWYIDGQRTSSGCLMNTWNDINGVNARRIVACVNACAGIDTEELEIVADGSETLKDCFDRQTAQRDKLLAALKEATDVLDALRRGHGIEVSNACYPAINNCRAIIAEIEAAK